MIKNLESILKEYTGKETELTPETELMKDLGMNSLELIEMAVDVEDTFGIEISDREITKLTTIGDVMNLIESKKQ